MRIGEETAVDAGAAGAGPLARLFATRTAGRIIALLLAAWTLGFVLFQPPAVTVTDENNYVRQAQLILHGGPTVTLEDPFTGAPFEFRPVNAYPLGTALALVPFVAAGGRAAAHVLPFLCVLVAVVVTACWLFEQGRSPLFAVLLLVYPATLVMGRVAMSEAPSLALVALGSWLYWRGLSPRGQPDARTVRARRASCWLGAGLLAGASFAFRETNVLVFAPFFFGSLLRRDGGWPWLLAGGALGLCVRFASAAAFFGDPFFTRSPGAFTLAAIPGNLPLYLASLLVGVPGGLVAAFAYRGLRRPELVATVAIFFVFHLAYQYSGEESGGLKRLVLGPRYFVSLLPVLAFAAAEAWPRLAHALSQRWSEAQRRAAERIAAAVLRAALVLLAIALVGVQALHAGWAADQAEIRDAIETHVAKGAVLVTDVRATGKYLDYVEGGRVVLPRDRIGAEAVDRLLERKGSFYVVLLDRSDSDFWRRNAFDNQIFVAGLRHPRELLLDLRASPTDRLRIWRVSE